MAKINLEMKGFIESSISNDFGLSVQQVAEKCKKYGRFRVWLNSDVKRIVQVLNIVKSNGVSPAFFASYERTEGYNGKWGWLNHTRIKGSPTNDADSVAKWIVSQSKNMSSRPAWIDYANYKDFVPRATKVYGNNHFSSLKAGTIGRVVVAGTAAATWEVYYPNGLKKSYNGTQNYSAPIKLMIDTIKSWGGKISGGTGGICFKGNIIDYYLKTTSGLYISSPYGMRVHPLTGARKMHAGEDIARTRTMASPPTPVPVASKILFAGPSGTTAGNWVVYNPIGTKYMIGIFHFGTITVKKGDTVQAGQSVGTMGASGNVTGRHWHIEVRDLNTNSFWGNKHYDPKKIIFNICDGGVDDGDIGEGETPKEDKKDDLIHLYLCGAVNNWIE